MTSPSEPTSTRLAGGPYRKRRPHHKWAWPPPETHVASAGGTMLNSRILMVFGVLMLLGFCSANQVLTSFALLILAALVWLLWRRGEPPTLFFICFFQWLQASVAVIYTDYLGVPLTGGEQDVVSPQFITATSLSLFGVMCVAVGMRLGTWNLKPIGKQAAAEARELSITKLFTGYLLAIAATYVLRFFALHVPVLAQPLLAALSVKWLFVFLLFYAVVHRREHYGLLVTVVLIETATGLLGYFSKFKDIYFVLGVVLLSAPLALTWKRLTLTAVVVSIVVAMGIVWSVIKAEYREYLNQGTNQQVVLVPVPERLDKIASLVSELDGPGLQYGIEQLVLRVSYVNFFSMCIANVPEAIPYEKGALWGGALQHIFMPRFLFPEKKAIDDSERTRAYTGVQVAGADEGTSISIGYMAESYVDFGRWGMMPCVAAFGGLVGFAYSQFIRRSRQKLIGLAVANVVVLFFGFSIEQSNIKLLGGFVMMLAVWISFMIFFERSLGHALRE